MWPQKVVAETGNKMNYKTFAKKFRKNKLTNAQLAELDGRGLATIGRYARLDAAANVEPILLKNEKGNFFWNQAA